MRIMEFNPKVSIIIPVYNGSNYLHEAIDSALAQDYANCEVIVVNDGSTDNGQTASVASCFGDRIRYVEQANGGVSSALNTGITIAEGDYISWLSHDDLYLPQKVSVQVDVIRKINRDVVLYGDYALIGPLGQVIRTVGNPSLTRQEFFNKLFLSGPIHGCTTLVPKSCFDEVGLFRLGLKTVQDYEMWYRLLKKYEFVHVSQVLIKSRVHEEQGHKTMSIIHRQEFLDLLEWWIDDMPVDVILSLQPPSLTSWYFRLALDYKKCGYTSAARKAFKLGRQYVSRRVGTLYLREMSIMLQYLLWHKTLSPGRYMRYLNRLFNKTEVER